MTIGAGIYGAATDNPDSSHLPIDTWIVMGAGTALAIPAFAVGVPLMIIGANREKRARGAVTLAPGGLAVRF
jgi:hypothetical protein